MDGKKSIHRLYVGVDILKQALAPFKLRKEWLCNSSAIELQFHTKKMLLRENERELEPILWSLPLGGAKYTGSDLAPGCLSRFCGETVVCLSIYLCEKYGL